MNSIKFNYEVKNTLDFNELRLYLLYQIESSSNTSHYKLEALNTLHKAEIKMSDFKYEDMEAYAHCIKHEIDNSEHRDLLFDLQSLIKPFILTKFSELMVSQ